jgi:hypothetical protein
MTAKVEYRRYMPICCCHVLRIRPRIDTGLLKGRHRSEVSAGHPMSIRPLLGLGDALAKTSLFPAALNRGRDYLVKTQAL